MRQLVYQVIGINHAVNYGSVVLHGFGDQHVAFLVFHHNIFKLNKITRKNGIVPWINFFAVFVSPVPHCFIAGECFVGQIPAFAPVYLGSYGGGNVFNHFLVERWNCC